MITIRPSGERGHFDHGWLNTYHTFSFADYYDPEHVHFRALRVINEDFVAAGRGFGAHPHRDMEIITYILDGSLQHKDSMGNGDVIRPGDVQRMSAGTGVVHSEFNPDPEHPVHLMQIWIMPDRANHTPSYEQTHFPVAERTNALRLVASNDGREGSVMIHQDAELYASLLPQSGSLHHSFKNGRYGWLQLASGELSVNGTKLRAGDGAAISGESEIVIESTGSETAEFLLFDLS